MISAWNQFQVEIHILLSASVDLSPFCISIGALENIVLPVQIHDAILKCQTVVLILLNKESAWVLTFRWNFHLFLALVILSYWQTTTLSVSKRSLKQILSIQAQVIRSLTNVTLHLRLICHLRFPEDPLLPPHHPPLRQDQGHHRRHHHRRPRHRHHPDHLLHHWNQQARQPKDCWVFYKQ